MVNKKWLVLCTLWLGNGMRQPSAPKLVSNGWIEGSISADGLMEEYLGIPYATIKERFQAPGPEPTWNGVFEATDDIIQCPQKLNAHNKISNRIIGQKDCLSLNIFVPITTPNKDDADIPVMVFIHGGGFLEGSSMVKIYGPQYLVPHGIILVTINYRLHIEGFLCLGTKDAPGNVGLKDQVAALKWVKKNIRKFGGDPDNITLFGESAGAASVSYHVISPMSKGLFHKAIQQSGSTLCPWALQHEPIKIASLLAKSLGHDTNDVAEMYELFTKKSEEELVSITLQRATGDSILSGMMFIPCVEKHIEGVPAFLTEMPYTLLKRGQFNKVPMIIGSNSNEGILFADMETDVSKIEIASSLPKNLRLTTIEKEAIAGNVSEIYMDNKSLSIKTIANLSKFIGEPFFNYPSQVETLLIVNSSKEPVYNYLFNFDGYNNILKMTLKKELRQTDGPSHADELLYLFKPILIPALEKEMIKRMTTMWTNFAKYGNPTPEVTELLPKLWPSVNLTAPAQTFVIDKEFSLVPLWFEERLKYWNTIYDKYRII